MADYLIKRADTLVPVDEFVDSCIDIPKFITCCEACPSYGNRWSCPPFDFNPMDIWKKYKTLHLHAMILKPLDSDGRKLVEGLWKEKPGFDLGLVELERAHPGSLALSGGTCVLCDECRRAYGEPCCYPEKQRYSIEALGGDVGKTCEKYFQKSILWVKDGVAPDYLMWVGGLLLPE